MLPFKILKVSALLGNKNVRNVSRLNFVNWKACTARWRKSGHNSNYTRGTSTISDGQWNSRMIKHMYFDGLRLNLRPNTSMWKWRPSRCNCNSCCTGKTWEGSKNLSRSGILRLNWTAGSMGMKFIFYIHFSYFGDTAGSLWRCDSYRASWNG